MTSEDQQQCKVDKDDWVTPGRVIDRIQEYDKIDLDPCAGETTDHAECNLTEADDGLGQAWNVPKVNYQRVAFVNPPFSDKTTWIRKAIGEFKIGNVDRVYLLTPDATSVKSWWHGLVVPHARWTWFPAGRVKFINPENGEKAGSPAGNTAVHVIGNPPSQLLRYWNRNGDLVYRFGSISEVRRT